MLIPLLLLAVFQNDVLCSDPIWAMTGYPDRVKLEVRVIEYSNPSFNLGDSLKCLCNEENECEQCMIRLNFAVWPGVYYDIYETGFENLDQNGELSKTSGSSFNKSFPMYPYWLRVAVENIGLRKNVSDDWVETNDKITPIDYFYIYFPNETNLFHPTVHHHKNFINVVSEGQQLKTKLSLQVSVSCIDPEMVGLQCDYKCTPSFLFNSLSVCTSVSDFNDITKMYGYFDDDYFRYLDECSSNWLDALICQTDFAHLWDLIRYKLLFGFVFIFGIILILVLTSVFKKKCESTMGKYVKKVFKKENKCVSI